MSLLESGKQVVVSLVVSALVAIGGLLYTADSQRVLLQQNIKAVEQLSNAVIDLRIQVAEDRGKYVTRDQLREELREIRRGS